MQGGRGWPGRLIGVLLAAVVLAGCGVHPDQPGPDRSPGRTAASTGGTLTVGTSAQPDGFNPHTPAGSTSATPDFTMHVLPSAFRLDDQMQPVMNTDLLEGAEIVSTAPQTVVYRIRKEAVWSDGTPISVRDFAYLWRGMVGLEPGAEVADNTGYRDVERITGSGDGRTVTVVFARPFGAWRQLFGQLLPAHVAARAEGGWNRAFAQGLPVSGGPFLLAAHDPGRQLTLIRNEQYYGTQARLDQLLVRFLTSVDDPAGLLEAGTVDMVRAPATTAQVGALRRLDGVRTRVLPDGSSAHLLVNTRNPVLAVPEVRQAIAHGLDRTALARTTLGKVNPEIQPRENMVWPPAHPAYVPHGVQTAPADQETARALLRQAGFAPDEDGFAARDGQRLTLRLAGAVGDPVRERRLRLVRKQLGDVGIDVQTQEVPEEALAEHLANGDFDLADVRYPDGDDPLAAAWSRYHSDSAGNLAGYRSSTADRLLEEASGTLDNRQRSELGNELDRYLWQTVPGLPLQPELTTVAWKRQVEVGSEEQLGSTVLHGAPSWGLGQAGTRRLWLG